MSVCLRYVCCLMLIALFNVLVGVAGGLPYWLLAVGDFVLGAS